MKKVRTLSIAPIFALSLLVYGGEAEASDITNDNGVTMTEEQVENLKEIGFTELQIQTMSNEIFEDNKDKELVSESTTIKYIEMKHEPAIENSTSNFALSSPIQTELSEEEYYERLNAVETFDSDSTSTSYRTLTTRIQTFTDDIRLRSEFEWDQMPVTRSMDVLATSIDSAFSPVSGSGYGQQLYTGFHSTSGETVTRNQEYSSNSSNWIHQSQGYALKMNLFDDPSGTNALDLSGYQYYEITLNSSDEPNLINAYGNYAHADVEVNLNYSVDLSFGGPGLSFSLEESTNFSEMTTHAQTDY